MSDAVQNKDMKKNLEFESYLMEGLKMNGPNKYLLRCSVMI